MRRRKIALLLLAAILGSVMLPGCQKKETPLVHVEPAKEEVTEPVAEKKEETITQEFDFYSDDEQILYYNFPTVYELNGKVYEQSGEILHETVGTRDVVELAVDLNVEELEEIPDSYSYEGKSGDTYELNNEQVYIEKEGEVPLVVTEEVIYEDQVGKPNVPTKKQISYYDKKEGKDQTVQGLLKDLVETVKGHWASILAIDGVFSAPSADVSVFELSGRPDVTVPQNAATPAWSGYETDVLYSLGLDTSYYRVTSAAWNGNPYVQDNQVMRNALFKGDAFVSTYKAVYEGTRYANGYAAKVFYRADASNVNAKKEDITTVYHIHSIVTYRLVEG